MNDKEIEIGDFKFTFKYCGDEAFTGEKTRTDGYRALIVGSNKNGLNYKILLELSDTSYNLKNDGEQKFKSEIIQDEYGNLENCFYQIGIKYLKEKISQNDLISEQVNIINYL